MTSVHQTVASLGPATPARLLDGGGTAPTPMPDAADLVAMLDAAGLTGRGGAGFATSRKLSSFLHHPPDHVVVVGNAMEGEPLSRKDQVLLTVAPDLVLDGLAVLAHALDARRVVLAVGTQIPLGPLLRARTSHAHGRRVEVLPLPDRFVAGQESALTNAVNGRPAIPGPRHQPVRLAGVDRRPTLVSNAETLAQITLVVRHGPAWWRTAGTADDPGTFLVTVSASAPGTVTRPGVLEVPRGIPLVDALLRAGTAPDRVAAVLVGGYHGAWVPRSRLDVPLAGPELRALGASPGAGVLHVLDRADCPLRVAAAITDYLAGQTAGQCGPCVNGLPALADAMHRLADPGSLGASPSRVDALCGLVDRRGACAHPDGSARLVRSTLEVFGDHVVAHLEGRCSRG
ncbi:NADH-ubiquinone oxidoreductase-F iron-sulfur binding region domain-containing protein [Nocardioides sp. GCM10027113]|uniref:NADH-ubiquinone oxidoreductase-F iron-sulfur binding region domain-containing protein n=1 Tax=unclassified Nocardioides TaxID=2615069 RepID=UPI00361F69CF